MLKKYFLILINENSFAFFVEIVVLFSPGYFDEEKKKVKKKSIYLKMEFILLLTPISWLVVNWTVVQWNYLVQVIVSLHALVIISQLHFPFEVKVIWKQVFDLNLHQQGSEYN